MIKIVLTAFLTFLMSSTATAQDAPQTSFSSPPSVLIAPPFRLFQGPFDLEAPGFPRKAAKVYLPLQYETRANWPVVILLHGFSGTAESQDAYLTLRFRASTRGFILITPDGSPTPAGIITPDGRDLSGNQFWNATDYCCDFGKTNIDDVGYLSKLIQTVKDRYAVDSTRVYLFGHSNGGFMANRLACEIGAELAGIANLAGGGFADTAQCRLPTAVPYLQIHALDDKTISYSPVREYAGGQAIVDQWVVKNGCKGTGQKGFDRDFLPLVSGNDTSETEWKHCSGGQTVALWTIKASTAKGHNPHIPLFNLTFTDAVLDFLFQHQR